MGAPQRVGAPGAGPADPADPPDPADPADPPDPGPFRLVPGRPAPVQLDRTTCGPTALTVARLLVDPGLHRWLVTGAAAGRDLPPGATALARAAAYHRVVHRRTTGLVGPTGRLQLPWPRRLGTPPWGVARELEAVAPEPDTRYRTVLVRAAGAAGLARLADRLARHLRVGRPGVLYVGDAWLPDT